MRPLAGRGYGLRDGDARGRAGPGADARAGGRERGQSRIILSLRNNDDSDRVNLGSAMLQRRARGGRRPAQSGARGGPAEMRSSMKTRYRAPARRSRTGSPEWPGSASRWVCSPGRPPARPTRRRRRRAPEARAAEAAANAPQASPDEEEDDAPKPAPRRRKAELPPLAPHPRRNQRHRRPPQHPADHGRGPDGGPRLQALSGSHPHGGRQSQDRRASRYVKIGRQAAASSSRRSGPARPRSPCATRTARSGSSSTSASRARACSASPAR